MNCVRCRSSICATVCLSHLDSRLSHPIQPGRNRVKSGGMPVMTATYLCTHIGLQQTSILPQPGTTFPLPPGRARWARGSAGHILVARCCLGATKPSQWTPPKSSNFPGSRGRPRFPARLLHCLAVTRSHVRCKWRLHSFSGAQGLSVQGISERGGVRSLGRIGELILHSNGMQSLSSPFS